MLSFGMILKWKICTEYAHPSHVFDLLHCKIPLMSASAVSSKLEIEAHINDEHHPTNYTGIILPSPCSYNSEFSIYSGSNNGGGHKYTCRNGQYLIGLQRKRFLEVRNPTRRRGQAGLEGG